MKASGLVSRCYIFNFYITYKCNLIFFLLFCSRSIEINFRTPVKTTLHIQISFFFNIFNKRSLTLWKSHTDDTSLPRNIKVIRPLSAVS